MRNRQTDKAVIPDAQHTLMLQESSPHAEIEHFYILRGRDGALDRSDLKAG
jgi:hypothetical protein